MKEALLIDTDYIVYLTEEEKGMLSYNYIVRYMHFMQNII